MNALEVLRWLANAMNKRYGLFFHFDEKTDGSVFTFKIKITHSGFAGPEPYPNYGTVLMGAHDFGSPDKINKDQVYQTLLMHLLEDSVFRSIESMKNINTQKL